MTCRIICPYCHSAIDPLTLESALSAQAHYRICPECDAAIVVSPPAGAGARAEAPAATHPTSDR